MMEDDKSRRGESVIYIDWHGRECPATIEFGNEREGFSLYLESGGRRIVTRTMLDRVRSDRGASRPEWESVTR